MKFKVIPINKTETGDCSMNTNSSNTPENAESKNLGETLNINQQVWHPIYGKGAVVNIGQESFEVYFTNHQEVFTMDGFHFDRRANKIGLVPAVYLHPVTITDTRTTQSHKMS